MIKNRKNAMKFLVIGCEKVFHPSILNDLAQQNNLKVATITKGIHEFLGTVANRLHIGHYTDRFYWICNAETTKAQIAEVRKLKLEAASDGTYKDAPPIFTLDSYESYFSRLVEYRDKQRHGAMADRPPVCVVGHSNGEIKLIASFGGHDWLEKDLLVYSSSHIPHPDFSDSKEYGLRVPGAGMINWYAGDFQHLIINRGLII